jgi:hypothetical protein
MSSIDTAGARPRLCARREALEKALSATGSPAPACDTDQTSAATQTMTARTAHERRRRIACR